MPFSPKTYQYLWIASLLVTLLLAAWTGISAMGGDRLGLSPQTMAWMGILAGVLGMLLGFLPPLQKTPAQNKQVVQQVQMARRLSHVAHQAQQIQPDPRAQQIQPDPRAQQIQPGPSFSETITPPRTSDPV
jgi:hypothetical protein